MSNIAFCGYDCSKCPVCLATISQDLQKLKEILKVSDASKTVDDLGCMGCKLGLINHMCDSCIVKKCCKSKNIENCGECSEFPCEYASKYFSKETMDYLNNIHKKFIN